MGTRYGPVKLRVPKGFPVLLQRFAREVLREQPSDVSKFGADYFKGLLDHRNSTGEDPLKTDPLDEPGFHTTPKKVLRHVSSGVRQKEIQQEIAASKIQAGYRGYRVRKQSRQQRDQTSELQQETAATKIQAQYRGYSTRKRRKTLYEKIPETEGPEEEDQEKGQQEHLQYSKDENNAAIRIQANFRGHQARKSLKPEKNEENSTAVVEAPKDVNEEMTAASVKIQASYRGHRTRKHLKETRNASLIDEAARLTVDDKEENQISDEKPDETEAIPDKEQGKLDMEENEETAQETAHTENEDLQNEAGLNDPEIQAAALKIQASFRGHRTRKQLKENMKESPQEEPKASGGGDADASETKPDLLSEPEHHVEQSFETPEESNAAAGDAASVPEKEDKGEEVAAIKIQAQYRGYRTRKLLKDNKVSEETPVTDVLEEKQDNTEPED